MIENQKNKPDSFLSGAFNVAATGQISISVATVKSLDQARQAKLSITTSSPSIEEIAQERQEHAKEQTARGPSLFEKIGNGLSHAFAAIHHHFTEPQRRKAALDDAMASVRHASFLRPNDAQTWLFRSDVAREMAVLAGDHYYKRDHFSDMPPHLRKDVDAARREIAYQTLIGPIKDMAQLLIDGGKAYDLPRRFTLSDRHMKQALEALEKINTTLGTKADDVEAWVRREEAAEEMAALMGDAIPQSILEGMPQEFAEEVFAKRRFVAFQRLTGSILEETLELRHDNVVALKIQNSDEMKKHF